MKILPDIMVGETKRLVGEGKSVILPVNGRSMRPFIIGGKDKVEFAPLPQRLQPGDVVMATVREGYPVVHRIVAVEGDQLTLEGDGNLGFQEHCDRKDVVAQGTWVIDPRGRRRSLTSPAARRKWRIWMRLKPLRRILLKIIELTSIF